jgi:hypothetical protein
MAAIAPTLIAVVFRVSGRTVNEEESRLLLFTAVPILLTIGGLFASQRDRDWVTWTAIGGLWGFVVLGAWSIGLFFVPAAIFLLASGLLRADARRNWWNVVLVPLWMLQGVCATAMLFLVVTVAREILGGARFVLPGQTREFATRAGTIASVPEIVMFGAWLFAATSCFLVACGLARLLWSRRTEGRHPQSTTLVVGLLVALMLGTAACQRAFGELQRRGSVGCSSVGSTTTCWAG